MPTSMHRICDPALGSIFTFFLSVRQLAISSYYCYSMPCCSLAILGIQLQQLGKIAQTAKQFEFMPCHAVFA